MSEELKPCPFCGGVAIPAEYKAGYGVIQCAGCGIMTDTGKPRTYEELVKAWNRRDGNGEGNRAFYNRVCGGVCDD